MRKIDDNTWENSDGFRFRVGGSSSHLRGHTPDSCLVRGSLIETVDGPVPVEDLLDRAHEIVCSWTGRPTATVAVATRARAREISLEDGRVLRLTLGHVVPTTEVAVYDDGRTQRWHVRTVGTLAVGDPLCGSVVTSVRGIGRVDAVRVAPGSPSWLTVDGCLVGSRSHEVYDVLSEDLSQDRSEDRLVMGRSVLLRVDSLHDEDEGCVDAWRIPDHPRGPFASFDGIWWVRAHSRYDPYDLMSGDVVVGDPVPEDRMAEWKSAGLRRLRSQADAARLAWEQRVPPSDDGLAVEIVSRRRPTEMAMAMAMAI